MSISSITKRDSYQKDVVGFQRENKPHTMLSQTRELHEGFLHDVLNVMQSLESVPPTYSLINRDSMVDYILYTIQERTQQPLSTLERLWASLWFDVDTDSEVKVKFESAFAVCCGGGVQ